MTAPKTADQLHAFLTELGITHKTYEHPPVFTVEEAQVVNKTQPGAHIKNLFLQDKKKTGLWLVTVLQETRVDLRQLEKEVGARGRLSFGRAELLMEKLGVVPGAVTPLAPINDMNKEVQVILDKRIFEYDIVNAHPLRNDRTTAISPADLLKFLQAVDHTPRFMDIPAVGASVAA
jgi:Ala-tRNA(Pro) deacylase